MPERELSGNGEDALSPSWSLCHCFTSFRSAKAASSSLPSERITQHKKLYIQNASFDSAVSPACIHLVSGALAGGVSRTVTAPLDRLKAVLQVTRSSRRVAALDTLKRLVVPECALKFVAYDYFKRKLIATRHSGELHVQPIQFRREIETEYTVRLSILEKMVSGGFAGALAQFSVYPMEVVKTRLAIATPGLYKGIIDCIKHTYRHEKFTVFYRGLCPSLLGIIPYAGLDLSCFETLKRECCHNLGVQNGEPPVYVILGCGAASSAIGQVVAYPLALVRTRLQADGVAGQPRQFNGMLDVFRQTISHEGYLALYRGLIPNLLKAVPAVSVTWAVYEATKQHLRSWTTPFARLLLDDVLQELSIANLAVQLSGRFQEAVEKAKRELQDDAANNAATHVIAVHQDPATRAP